MHHFIALNYDFKKSEEEKERPKCKENSNNTENTNLYLKKCYSWILFGNYWNLREWTNFS